MEIYDGVFYTEEQVSQMTPEEREELVGLSAYEFIEAGFLFPLGPEYEFVYIPRDDYERIAGPLKRF